MNLELLAKLNAEISARRSAVVVTDVASGQQHIVCEQDVEADPLGVLLDKHLSIGKSVLVEQDGRQLFLDVYVPPIKMIIIGAVHVAQALAPMAVGLDLNTTIVDPRSAFASPDRFPGISVLAEWPDDALPQIGLDRRTALVTLTHDPKIDDRALSAALRSECFYIGALGSRSSHAQRLGRLGAAGFTEADLRRIHGPIGLNIGAILPAEIAVSILAEVIAVLRKDRREEREAAPI
jgi:xanthine dehydrogenase accessory factor